IENAYLPGTHFSVLRRSVSLPGCRDPNDGKCCSRTLFAGVGAVKMRAPPRKFRICAPIPAKPLDF
ncbi:MAG: hypothetical protein IKQ87_06830, partial [Clostridia bacterium]|nr:hypothetical protein [Clostridia bacterium]